MNRRQLLGGLAAGAVASRLDINLGLAATPIAGDYAQPEWLVDPAWLSDQDGVKVVGLMAADAFAAGHIPGSVAVDWPELDLERSDPESLAAWVTRMETLFGGLGLDREDTVVVYDDGSFYGARLWWVLYLLGQADVRILNGGLPAWSAADKPLTKVLATPVPAVAYQSQIRQDAIVGIDRVKALAASGAALFIDARNPDEYAAGHIPAAVNVPFRSNGVDGSPAYWKSADELRSLYLGVGVHPGVPVVPYCTTGVRSAATYFTLRLIGHDEVALFSGSWREWSESQ